MTEPSTFSIDFPFAYGKPAVSAKFRTECEDFVVNEILGFEASGDGEHVVLEVLKRDDNTPWVAKQIARIAGVKPMDVGYCGLKDRRAVTRQWFSVYLPKPKAIDWRLLNGDTIQYLSHTQHNKKLRRGEHAANQFIIRLRDVQGDTDGIEQRLLAIKKGGVPNYFGEQRFGREQANLHQVDELFSRRVRNKNPQQKGMVLSAARSWVFNQVLAARVAHADWQALLDGEPQPYASGPLWGRGRNLATGLLGEFEADVLTPWQAWCDGLEHAGLSQERRALVQTPIDFAWRWEGQHLVLEFSLAPGQFATSLLREIADLELVEE
ncbi:tRNA pseudouridine(13) synthase TruD [Simiduia litorea]|uniref:tRNA pseudouridine(13) synthase TruD n=1 Tax=Simiduia litorea TaxID=1435348 RepID=UPI0036F2EC98